MSQVNGHSVKNRAVERPKPTGMMDKQLVMTRLQRNSIEVVDNYQYLIDINGLSQPPPSRSKQLIIDEIINRWKITLKQLTKFLFEKGVLSVDVADKLFPTYFDYKFLAKATGKSPQQLGME